MASAVTSKCFKPASFCDNCDRKASRLYKKENVDVPLKVAEANTKGGGSSGKHVNGGQSKSHKKKENIDHKTKSKEKDSKDKVGDRKTYKRCTRCWLTSYCDETCQKEHWNKVHRYHCDFLSGRKVSDDHKEDSCGECIAQKTTSRDELLDINSPKTGCRFKEESRRMKRELGKSFGFHGYGQHCNCGNEFVCEHPFPMGKIQGNTLDSLLDEMIVHAAKLSNAFIVKSIEAKGEKDTISRLFDLHKSILDSRVVLWVNILIFGDIVAVKQMVDMLENSTLEVKGKLDIENPWWKSLEFTVEYIWTIGHFQKINIQLKDISIADAKFSEMFKLSKDCLKNVALISENNAWHRLQIWGSKPISGLKMWPKKVNNSLVLLLPSDVLCISCSADLSGQVVGLVDGWDPSNPSPSLFSLSADNGGVTATCSPVQNFDCGKDYASKIRASMKLSEEEGLEYTALREKTRRCHLCLVESVSSHRCSRCLAVQYCSMECAQEDFAFHKTVCNIWAKDPTRSLMSSGEQKDVNKKLLAANVDKLNQKRDQENR